MLTDKNRQATTAWKPLWILVESQTGTTRIASQATITIGKRTLLHFIFLYEIYAASKNKSDKDRK